MILMAGHEAQKMFRPSSIRSYHRRSDFQTIADLMLRVAPTHEVQAVYSKLLRIRTRNLLKGNWHCVHAVAQALMERRKMKGAEVICAIRQGMDDAHFAVLSKEANRKHG